MHQNFINVTKGQSKPGFHYDISIAEPLMCISVSVRRTERFVLLKLTLMHIKGSAMLTLTA